jgi:diacylglycerol kinase (ATP)
MMLEAGRKFSPAPLSGMPFSLTERARSFLYAFRGIGIVIATQHNAWIHLVATACAAALGFFVHLDRVEWCLIVFAIALVWVTEAVNTAIEFLADEITLEQREGIGRAKDVGAAAVLLAAIASVAIGAIVVVPHLLALAERQT